MCVLRGEMCSLGEKKLLEAAVTIAKAECWLGAGRGFALRRQRSPCFSSSPQRPPGIGASRTAVFVLPPTPYPTQTQAGKE